MLVLKKIIDNFLRIKKQLQKHRRLVTCLAAAVVFATTYAMILPAVSMDKDTADSTPGISTGRSNFTQKVSQIEHNIRDNKDLGNPNEPVSTFADIDRQASLFTQRVSQKQQVDDAKKVNNKQKEAPVETADSAEYKAARDAVLKTKKENDENFNEADLGVAALDITVRDAEGKEVEPRGKVGVKIEMDDLDQISGDLPDNAAPGSLQVAHIKDGTAEALADTADSTGGSFDVFGNSATVKFNTESFSTYAVTYSVMKAAAAGNTVEVGVGETLALSGTEGYGSVSWVSSDSSVATVSNNGIVTGVSTGTATITHTYYTKKNKKSTGTESWTVNVTEASETTDTEIKSNENSGLPTVTVKGHAKALNGYKVKIESVETENNCFDQYIADLNSVNAADKTISDASDFDFLKFYKICLYDPKTGEEAEPKAVDGKKVNLQVTLTYDSGSLPAGWDSAKTKGVWAAHYNSNGKAEDISDNGSSYGKIKKLTIAGNNQIKFHLKSFSTFGLAAAKEAGSGGESDDPDAETTVTEGSSIMDGKDYEKENKKNEWQIVKGRYKGNGVNKKTGKSESKTTYSSDGKVRMQKNIIPAENENEFYVYLSIDKKEEKKITTETYDKYLSDDLSRYLVGSASHFPGSEQAGEIGGLQGSVKGGVNTSGGKKNKTYTITYTYKGKTVGTGRFEADISNSCIYLDLGESRPSDKRYIAVAEFKKNAEATVELSDDAYTALKETVVNQTENTSSLILDQVTDEIGKGYELTGETKQHGTVSASGNKIIWNITENQNPTKVVTTSGSDSSKKTEIWSCNVAELLYKVKYTPPSSTGMEESTGNAVSVEATPEDAIKTLGTSAVLNYTANNDEKTAEFDQPAGRGMLYELRINKVRKGSDAPVQGAVFGIYSDENCTSFVKQATSTSEGLVDFTDLQTGTYWVKEISAPSGYKLDTTVHGPYTMNYTNSSTELTGQGASEEALYKNADGSAIKIENEPDYNVVIYKMSSTGPLSGATITLKEGDGTPATIISPNTTSPNSAALTSDQLKLDTVYTISEISAPDGYNKVSDIRFKLVEDTSNPGSYKLVKSDGSEWDSASPLQNVSDPLTSGLSGEGKTIVLQLTNTPGAALPSTGGPGIWNYMIGGLVLAVLAAAGLTRRRRHGI